MGYRSDVRIIIPNEDFDKLKEFKFDDCGKEKSIIEVFERVYTCSCDSEYTSLEADWVKWYNEYAEVKTIMNFIRELKQYYYARIGEETDDVEEEASNEFYSNYAGIYPLCRTFVGEL